MRKQRHTARGGGQNLGRVGALGVLAAGALCAAVLSVASRVPPTPIDTAEIPSVEIGPPIEDAVTPPVRRDRRSGARRAGKRGSSARERGGSERRARKDDSRGRGVRAGGSALPVAYGQSGGDSGRNAIARPQPGGRSERPVSGTGPRPGSGGGDPGAPGNRDGARQSDPGGGGGGNGGQPRNVPAPTSTQPAVGEAADDNDDAAIPTATAASEDDGESESEGEVETDPVPAAAIPSPTLVRSGDSDPE